MHTVQSLGNMSILGGYHDELSEPGQAPQRRSDVLAESDGAEGRHMRQIEFIGLASQLWASLYAASEECEA